MFAEQKLFTVAQRVLRFVIVLVIAVIVYKQFISTATANPDTDTAYLTQFIVLCVLLGVLVLAIGYLIFIYWFVHFILPITSNLQKWPAFKRILAFGLSRGNWHGPAIFVRDGKIIGDLEETNKNRPGVAFLDLRSAMILDKFEHVEDDDDDGDRLTEPQKVHFSLLQSKPYAARIRAVGPGLTFIEKHEKIKGTLDLRPQSRARDNVTGDTRDGIRVKTSVNAVFSLGQPPDILDVYLGEDGQTIYTIEWDKNPAPGEKTIKNLTRDLSFEDEAEILRFIQDNPNPATVTSDLPAEKYPFAFDPLRAEQAIYSVANLSTESREKTWCDWAQDVTAEEFRILLSQKPYLSLYHLDNPDFTPMKEIKDELKKRVRNKGVLAFRVIRRQNHAALNMGDSIPESKLVMYPPRTLTSPKVLRDRGIKIIHAGFGELEPLEENVRKQFQRAWLAEKKKEDAIKSADTRLEEERIKNFARLRTARMKNHQFAKLLEKQEYPREALAILIFQELEAAAANPKTRSLLPENTLEIMNSIGQLLMQTQNDDRGKPTSINGTSEQPFDHQGIS